MLEAFAASAATAIATAVSVQTERANQRLMAAEHERTRWARELHDETLQNLAALQIAIAGHLRTRDPEAMAAFMGEAAEHLQAEIQNLRSLISELRPAALDDLGLEAAMRALAERTRQQGLEVRLSVDLMYDQNQASGRARAGDRDGHLPHRPGGPDECAQARGRHARQRGPLGGRLEHPPDRAGRRAGIRSDRQGSGVRANRRQRACGASPRRVRGQLGAWQGHHTESVTVPSRRAARGDALSV